MTSYQDNIPFIPSSPKLPAISSGGLVTGPESYIFKKPKDEWAGVLRRQIAHSLHVSGRAHPEDVAQLQRELVKLIITVLQPNSSKEAWLDLNSAFGDVEPFVDLLAVSHGRVGLAFQTQHYVERLYVLYQGEASKYFDIPIIESMRKIFPNEVEAAEVKFGQTAAIGSSSPTNFMLSGSYYPQRSGTAHASRGTRKQMTFEESIASMKRSVTMDLPDGRNPYNLMRRGDEPEHYFRPRPITVGDFNKSISGVAMESAAKESTWKESQSSTVAALAVDLEPLPASAPPDPKKWIPFATSAIDDFEDKTSAPTSPRKLPTEFKSITGREAVELFLKGKHLNQVEFIYFNLADSRHYRPYDLVSVPEDKAKAEHYVFSTFGVLHVHPDAAAAETMTLAEWNRRAVLWGVMSKIGFFKNFLICRTLKHWRNTVRRLRLMRVRSFLRMNLLHAVPEFGSALLHVFRLVGELSELQMLPNEDSKRQFTVLEFESEVAKKKKETDKMLGVFFRYCKKVVDVTREECFDQLKHYEYQVRHSKSLFSKESLYLQRKKRQVRLINLENARQAVRHLSSFITLVDQIISVHLLEVLRTSVRRFVSEVLCSFDKEFDEDYQIEEPHSAVTSPSKGHPSNFSTKGESTAKTGEKCEYRFFVFMTKMVFNGKTYELEMQPSPTKFREAVCSCVGNLISAMCEEAHSMNVSGRSGLRDQAGSPSSSVNSAPASTSERSSVASLSSEFEGQDDFEDSGGVGGEESDGEGQEGFAEPDLPSKKMPSKEEDEMGVATPNLVLSPDPGTRFGLMVDGEGVMGQFNPLDQSKLKNKLTNDDEIRECLDIQNDTVTKALEEVEAFCIEHNKWIVAIRKFTCEWKQSTLNEWRGKPAHDIENMLTMIKSWSDSVRINGSVRYVSVLSVIKNVLLQVLKVLGST